MLSFNLGCFIYVNARGKFENSDTVSLGSLVLVDNLVALWIWMLFYRVSLRKYKILYNFNTVQYKKSIEMSRFHHREMAPLFFMIWW